MWEWSLHEDGFFCFVFVESIFFSLNGFTNNMDFWGDRLSWVGPLGGGSFGGWGPSAGRGPLARSLSEACVRAGVVSATVKDRV